MDTLSGLEVFVQTAHTQSFVATGRALGISASAVSKSVSRLEARIGVRLFQRSTRTVRLTSEGEVFLERCRRILGELQAAEDDLSAMTQVPAGRLRVGLAMAAGLPFPVLAAFMARYPHIELDLDFTDRLVDVIDEGFDVVIRGSELRDSRLISRPIGPFGSCIVASPDYLRARGVPVKPEALLHHACLHYRWASTGKISQWPLRHASTQALPSTLVCGSIDALLYMAEAGRGIACLPDFAVKAALADGRLVSLLDTYLSGSSTFHVVWPSSRQMTSKVRVFVDFILAHFAERLVPVNAATTTRFA